MKKEIDSVNKCLRKVEVEKARRMVHDRNEWLGFLREITWSLSRRGRSPEFDEVTLCEAPMGEVLAVVKLGTLV